MEPITFLTGVIISGLVQILKSKFGMAGTTTGLVIALFAVVGGVVFFFANMYGFWNAIYQIGAAAGAFYAFIIQNDHVKSVLGVSEPQG